MGKKTSKAQYGKIKPYETVVDKVKWLSGVIHEGQLLGGVYLVVDVWEQSYGAFHKMVRGLTLDMRLDMT